MGDGRVVIAREDSLPIQLPKWIEKAEQKISSPFRGLGSISREPRQVNAMLADAAKGIANQSDSVFASVAIKFLLNIRHKPFWKSLKIVQWLKTKAYVDPEKYELNLLLGEVSRQYLAMFNYLLEQVKAWARLHDLFAEDPESVIQAHIHIYSYMQANYINCLEAPLTQTELNEHISNISHQSPFKAGLAHHMLSGKSRDSISYLTIRNTAIIKNVDFADLVSSSDISQERKLMATLVHLKLITEEIITDKIAEGCPIKNARNWMEKNPKNLPYILLLEIGHKCHNLWLMLDVENVIDTSLNDDDPLLIDQLKRANHIFYCETLPGLEKGVVVSTTETDITGGHNLDKGFLDIDETPVEVACNILGNISPQEKRALLGDRKPMNASKSWVLEFMRQRLSDN